MLNNQDCNTIISFNLLAAAIFASESPRTTSPFYQLCRLTKLVGKLYMCHQGCPYNRKWEGEGCHGMFTEPGCLCMYMIYILMILILREVLLRERMMTLPQKHGGCAY